ncbi:MAG: hypothetical protein GVX96_06190 [Bacteroidetes bacterium]|jgi:hypothetical protein|nr:hypothetical protein [Bacteroidota bacterium]
MRILSILVGVLVSFQCALGQEIKVDIPSAVILDEEVRKQFVFWKASCAEQDEILVWRILVAGLRDRRSLNRAIDRFQRQFPDLPYDWEYDNPLYKLKTGVCLHRLDLKPLFVSIRDEFPSALEIRDKIGYEEYFNARSHEKK